MDPKSNKKLKLAHWNANSILGKWSEAKDFIQKHEIDIMAISETKLGETNKLAMRGYTIHRKDRNKRGGGVLIICSEDLDHYQLDTNTASFESIGIKIKNGPSIFSIYVPPNTKTIQKDELNKIFTLQTQYMPWATAMPNIGSGAARAQTG